MSALPPGRFCPTPHFRPRRQRTLTRMRLIDAAGAVIDILVRDISPRGMSAAVRGAAPALNEPVQMLPPPGSGESAPVWGLVRWVEGNLIGVEFEPPGPAAYEAAPEPVVPVLPRR